MRHAAPSGKPPNSVVVTPQGNGPLAWVLANRHRLGLHNREALDAAPNAQNRYPGMRAENVAGTDDTGRMVDVLPRPARGEVEYCPSLLTHPITAGDRMLGLLVANGREGAPFVFRDWDDKGLGIIAQMLGGHWLSAHQRRIEREELAVRRRAADITGEFVRAVPRLSGRPDGYHALLVAALDAACRIAAVDVIADIRVYDDAAHEFRFDRGLVSARERERFATLRGFNAPFPATPGRQADARNGAEYVMRGGMPAVVDAENPPHWFKNRFPGEFRHAIFVPVFRGANPTEPAALIDVRIVGDGAFPISCADALHGLAMLLDLSLGFSASRRELDATVAKLRAGEEWQNAAFEDLSHQILSPQRNAMTQISALLRLTRKVEEPFLREDLNRAVLIARGQVRRANRVGRAASLFAELSRTRTIATAAKAVPLPRDAIIASLINLVSDQRLLSPSRKGLKFDLGKKISPKIYLLKLILSVVGQKYSLQGTEVTIAARRVNEEFILEVANYGYDILDHEVARLTSRNFRGQEARDRVASGHGIGLWLVKALAESFGGTLRITVGHQKQAPHRFALVFPRRGGGEG
ncbi:MAG: hypothetical protein NT133_15225 [Alphaproteobacteria bacterium]|nr:hypothetical protein [Alphaproteobacteria bacterium]